jgi:hypothetical protein
MTLAWVGLLAGQRVFAADWAPNAQPAGQPYEVILPGATGVSTSGATGNTDSTTRGGTSGGPAAESDLPVVGEHQPPAGGLFGDTPPPACEFCGSQNGLPPTWSVDNSISAIAMSRPNNLRLGTTSLPAGPLPAGSTSFTNSSNGVITSNVYTQYLNDAVQSTAMEVHAPALTVSPAWGFTLSRFLGRDGESRDHFLDFSFNGLESFTSLTATASGSIIPFYNTTPVIQAIPAQPPKVLYFQGSLNSPFPVYLPINGNQQELISPSFSQLGLNYDQAFNRSELMSEGYHTSYNEFEINYRFAGHNQPDQLVMNPNGRWYRECQNGYYYSYFFGMKGMFINEDFGFLSSGSQYMAAGPDANGNYSPVTPAEFTHQGTYNVHTDNTLLGFQSGGKLEYRFCRWTLDTHGNAGMFLNFAHQQSVIQTSFTGAPDQASAYAVAGFPALTATNNEYSASSTAVAFAGGFGVGGSYKFLPNLVGHVAYDMLWIGDIARAPEQMQFSSTPTTQATATIDTKGNVFYDGFSFGLEWDW